jgi:hypothetical protein
VADMKRNWRSTGVASLEDIEISPETKQHICITLNHSGLTPSDDFFVAITQAISRFYTGKEIADLSSPSAIRSNLSSAKKAAHQLNDKLNKLDHNSRLLIGEVMEGGVVTMQFSLLDQINKALTAAALIAEKYPRSGRLTEAHRLWLAADVAAAIREYVGVEPSSTKDGLFESILCIIFAEVTGQETTSHHELVRKALQVKITKSNGLVEYSRIKDD